MSIKGGKLIMNKNKEILLKLLYEMKTHPDLFPESILAELKKIIDNCLIVSKQNIDNITFIKSDCLTNYRNEDVEVMSATLHLKAKKYIDSDLKTLVPDIDLIRSKVREDLLNTIYEALEKED